jgi:hypothetical protein
MGLLDEPVKVGEWNGLEFYKDSLTESLTRHARKMSLQGIELRGWSVYVVKDIKTGNRAFVLFDDKGMAFRDSNSMEGMAYEIDFLKSAMSMENNIVDMAEKRNAESKKNKKRKKKDKERYHGFQERSN